MQKGPVSNHRAFLFHNLYFYWRISMSDAPLAERISWAEQNLQRQLDWIGRHDARTAVILGLDIAMLGFLATEIPAINRLHSGPLFFAAISTLTLLISLASIYSSQYPRTSSPNDSLVFFGTISAFTRENFSSNFCTRSEREHFNDLCDQAHINASIISKKFEALKLALVFLLVSIIPWTFAIVLVRTHTQ
jgi:hypothetical protein